MTLTARNRTIFLDCDGVLADFDKRAHEIFGMFSREYEELHGSEAFWNKLYSTPNFFTDLEPMPDAYELVEAVEHLNPIILTGCPRGGWATRQKLEWRDKYFPKLHLITCLSKEKSIYCRPGDVIVDDWPKHIDAWTSNSGHWILHTSAKQSIAELKALGII